MATADETKHTFTGSWLLIYQPYYTEILEVNSQSASHDAQWEGMGDVGSARYEPALLPRCPTIRVLSYSNW